MTDRELVVLLQKQNLALSSNIDSLTKTIEKLNEELSELKTIILKKDNSARKLEQLANINLPKKTEKRKTTSSIIDPKTPAPTPKKRGNNGAKRKVYDNIEEIIEDLEWVMIFSRVKLLYHHFLILNLIALS